MKRILLSLAMFAMAPLSFAQNIHIIVPFAAGGPTDRVARLVQKDLKDISNKNVIIENRPGGNGVIATNHMMQLSKTDTAFMIVGTAINFAAKPSVHDADLEAVATIGKASMVLVVPSSSNIKKFQDFIAIDKNKSLAYSNGGRASLSYLAGESLRYHTNKNFISVSYPNAPKMMIDLLSGQLDFGIMHVNDIIQHVDQKQLVPLAVFSETRLFELPDIPTMRESGIRDGVVHSHYMLIGPTSNSRSDVALVQTTLTKSLSDPALAQPYRQEGLYIAPGNKALDQQWWQQEIARLRSLAARIKLQTEEK